MTGGKSPTGYLKAYMTNLYLSKDSEKVTEAIEEGKTSRCAARGSWLKTACDLWLSKQTDMKHSNVVLKLID